MKKTAFILIGFYNKLLSPILKNILGVRSSCRFSPTCSEYARINIEKYGLGKGGIIFFERFLRCQPFAKI